MCNWSFEATGILEAKLFMGLMSTCSRVQRVDWQEKPQSDLREFYAQNTTSSSAHSLAKKWPQPATQNQWSFKITLTGPGGLSAVIVKRQPTEEQGQREKEQLDKNMGTDSAHHQPGTSTVLSKWRATTFYGLQRHLSFFLYWKQPICSRQHY